MNTKRNTSAAFALAFVLSLTGCSSTPKAVSGLEQVQQNRAKLDETREKLKKASEELDRMQRTLEDLQGRFAKTEDISTREKAKNALSRLSLKVQESELDFADLLAQNRILANNLDAQLRSVAEVNNSAMKAEPQKRASNSNGEATIQNQ